jgi:hypothetical protein
MYNVYCKALLNYKKDKEVYVMHTLNDKL